MIRPRQLAVLLAITIAVAAPAHVASASAGSVGRTSTARVHDPSKDVTVTATPRDSFLRSADITDVRLRYVMASKRLRVAVKFYDLKRLTVGTGATQRWYEQRLEVGVPSHGNLAFGLVRSPWASGDQLYVFSGDGLNDCEGFRHVVSVAKDRIVLTIPTICLGGTRAKFRVSSTAMRTFADAASQELGHDAARVSDWVGIP